MSADRSLDKKVVLISGCSSGFGAACAHEFVDAGYRVIATSRHGDGISQANDPSMDWRRLDVTNADSIHRCIQSVVSDYGRIDVLVNNAGIHLLGSIEDMLDADFRQVFETNFFGAVNLARAVLPTMRGAGCGHIITVSSIGSLVGRVMDGAYCASKAAVEIAFEAMKHEVGRFGIQVAVVCPGAFKTNIGSKLKLPSVTTAPSPYHDLAEFRLDKVQAAVEQGGNPAEVAQAIRRIASDPSPVYRNVIGDKAIWLQNAMTGLDQKARESLVRKIAGIEWWASGGEHPGEQADQ